MTPHQPLILITNDDGVMAKGLHQLVMCACQVGHVIVAAPSMPQSGMSAAITVGRPLCVTPRPAIDRATVYAVDGTPTDCVKLAMHALLPRRPDIVLSGINHGSNAATSVTYSGTMGAVMEGCLNGIPSIGFSLLDISPDADFELSAPIVTDIIRLALDNPLPQHTALNVNIPSHIVPEGIRACRAAHGHWTDEFERYVSPHGMPFFWLAGRFVNDEPEATDTDEYWLSQGYVSVVPVTPDQTSHTHIAQMAPIYDR